MKYSLTKRQWNTPLDQVIIILYFILSVCLVGIFFLLHILPQKIIAFFNVCIFHQITHLYCPGCGGTRAVQALMNGHLIRSFLFHPIPVYTLILGIIFFLGRLIAYLTKGKRNFFHAHICFLWFALILILGNFVIKNYLLLVLGIAVMK